MPAPITTKNKKAQSAKVKKTLSANEKKAGISKDDWKALSSATRKKGSNVIPYSAIKEYKNARVTKDDWNKMSNESKKKGTNLISYDQIRETRASKAMKPKNPSKKINIKNETFLGGRTRIK
jgi:hypothetical protein